MTSRTPMGAQPRPPQRTLSSSSLSVPRPSLQQRSLSQQYLPSSPVRAEQSPDAASVTDSPQGRHGASFQRGASRLRLELSSDPLMAPPSATNSPQGLTPSRMLPLADPMETMSPAAMSRSSQQDLDNPPMPMPRRRVPMPQHAQQYRDPPRPSAPVKKDARPKPWTVEIPTAAPRYVSGIKTDPKGRHDPSATRNDAASRDPFSKGLYSGYADFFPWNNHHHEDEWSGEAIQKGTWDRGTQTETSSARLAIFPALKQKSGLNALSTIFMGVFNQRRHRGQVTAPSTFKPPPRVTLTDTKREVWLRDLSNPAISLRRLSRTIPHGIRGRTLLDQCLNKNVPTERAVWLAKCVGANEIRAFKRKGVNGAFVMGGELKWVRDWTVFVEQFVDSVVSAFGEPDWRAKVTYAIRLATNLYSEHLIDRDHYLDWIISSLETCPQSKMPMWLLVVQICWGDLMRIRKFGRRLVFTLLTHLHTIQNDPDRDVLIQLSNRLAALLRSLVKANPSSFIHTTSWLKYRDTMKAYLPADDAAAQAAYDRVNLRNARLLVASTASPPAGRQQLVKLLDSTLQNSIDPELSAKCWACSEDKKEVVRTVVEWGTSFHRPGLAKVYTTASLIKSWGPYGCGATTAVLAVLDGIPAGDDMRKKLAYQLVTELIRNGHFSVAQYMQWLIARGGLSNPSDIDPSDGPCAIRLLLEMPTYCLPDKWRNERSNLLRRAGNYSVESEENDISMALKHVDHTLGLPLPEDEPMSKKKPMSLRKLLTRMGQSTKALRSCVGAHLRDTMAGHLPTNGDFAISMTMFTSVRAILEAADDFSMLSDVLKACSMASNTEVLASCADTINANLRIFMALGTADDLFNGLVGRLRSIGGEQGVAARPLLAALACLAQRMADRGEVAKQLQQKLAQSDRNNAIDACSPVSDNNMVSQMQGGEAEVSEEIDKLLASGNTIDPPTMNRLFRNIVPKLEAGWAKANDSRRIFSLLLTRLRIFDTQHFDRIMADWVSHVRSLKTRPPLPDLFPLLVSLGCLSISTLLHTANAAPSTADNGPINGSSTYLQELLQLALMKLPAAASLSPEEAYRFHIFQQSAKSDHSKGFLILIRNAVVEYSRLRSRSDLVLPIDDPSCQECILDTLRGLVVVDSNAVIKALNINSLPPEATGFIHTIMTKLLVPGNTDPSQASFDEILSLANELTMPFCQLKLDLDLSMVQDEGESEQQGPSRFDLFAKAMDRAIEARNIIWTGMLPHLSEDITQHLKNQAHSRFLDLIPSPKSAAFVDEATSEHRIQLAQNLSAVSEAIISGQPPSRSAQLTATLAEKLSDLWETIAAKDDGKDEARTRARAMILSSWLPAMLRFITLHGTSSESAPLAAPNPTVSASGKAGAASHEARARIVIILCGLLLDLEALPRSLVTTLPQQAFDIAILLVDDLPDDLRASCARAILLLPGATASPQTSSDPRLYYLLSTPQPPATENLMLAHRERAGASTPQNAAMRGMGAMYGIGPAVQERLTPFALRRWEVLSEPTPNVGENDTSLSLGLFEAIKLH